MRKFTFLAVASLCAAALAGCVDNRDTQTVKGTKTHVSLTAGIETRTANPEAPVWSANDAIGVHFVEADIIDNHHRLESTLTNDNSTATFSGDVSLTEGNYTIYGYYPHGELGEETNHHATAKIEVPAVQRPTATSFDPAADVMIMWPVEHEHNGTDIIHEGLQFKRALSMIKIVLDSEELGGEAIQNLTFTTNDTELKLAGMGHFDLANGEFIEFYNGAVTEVTAEPENVYANGTDAIILCVPAVTIASGVELTITGETEGFTFEKSTTLAEPIQLETGNWHTMNVTLSGDEIQPKSNVMQLPNGQYREYLGANYGVNTNSFVLTFSNVNSDGNGTELSMVLILGNIDMGPSVEEIDIPERTYSVSLAPGANSILHGNYSLKTYVTDIVGGVAKPISRISAGDAIVSGNHENYSISFNMTHATGALVAEFNGPLSIPNPNN